MGGVYRGWKLELLEGGGDDSFVSMIERVGIPYLHIPYSPCLGNDLSIPYTHILEYDIIQLYTSIT